MSCVKLRKCSEKPRPIPAALFLVQCVVRVPAQWHFQPKHFREIHDLLSNKPRGPNQKLRLNRHGCRKQDTSTKVLTLIFFLFLNHSPAGAQISCSVVSFRILNWDVCCQLASAQYNKVRVWQTTRVLLSQAGLATALSKANLQKYSKRLTLIFKFFNPERT